MIEWRPGNVLAVFWPEGQEDAVGEPAILVRSWQGDGSVSLQQKEDSILLHALDIPRLIEVLRRAHKDFIEK